MPSRFQQSCPSPARGGGSTLAHSPSRQERPMPPFDPRASINRDQYLDLSWEMFGELCRALALRVARDYDPEMVIGIARAGVIPGAVVASILREDFHSMKISRRDGDEQVRDRPAILSSAPATARRRRVLIVDEIASSGETLRMALAAVRNVAPA